MDVISDHRADNASGVANLRALLRDDSPRPFAAKRGQNAAQRGGVLKRERAGKIV